MSETIVKKKFRHCSYCEGGIYVVRPLPSDLPEGKGFKQLSLTIKSLSDTLHLRYGWDPRTKVIACITRLMCAEGICNRMILHFHIIANMGF